MLSPAMAPQASRNNSAAGRLALFASTPRPKLHKPHAHVVSTLQLPKQAQPTKRVKALISFKETAVDLIAISSRDKAALKPLRER